ncbi:hypothetical protein [Hymenobacter sp. YC55]|uniref:hypothetical protein n=1 Tax=Hymenobacter sp. YC55 TaxID=3034019 RepID=UPI0023F9D431|nr:hypothetical protein [Hymenobacter sp. YC55]MDF7813594.1 hypothetical protein [Hymenobacter sp. YC55]
MKQLLFDTGGRPIALDDFDVLQSEVYTAVTAVLAGAPPMALSGLSVTRRPNNRGDITAGYMWLNGRIQRFEGQTDVQLPAEIVFIGNDETDYRAYQTGGSKPCMTEMLYTAQPLGTYPANVEKLVVSGSPELTYAKWLESKQRTLGEVQWLASHNGGLYSATGLGYADGPARGWALCNGQNGTADLRARFIVGLFEAHNDYSQVGKKGGAERVTLSIEQLPAHSHGMEQAGEHTHGLKSRGSDGSSPLASRGNNPTSDQTIQTEKAGNHTHVINETGGNQEHENRPPFYVLAARQWVGL